MLRRLTGDTGGDAGDSRIAHRLIDRIDFGEHHSTIPNIEQPKNFKVLQRLWHGAIIGRNHQ